MAGIAGLFKNILREVFQNRKNIIAGLDRSDKDPSFGLNDAVAHIVAKIQCPIPEITGMDIGGCQIGGIVWIVNVSGYKYGVFESVVFGVQLFNSHQRR